MCLALCHQNLKLRYSNTTRILVIAICFINDSPHAFRVGAMKTGRYSIHCSLARSMRASALKLDTDSNIHWLDPCERMLRSSIQTAIFFGSIQASMQNSSIQASSVQTAIFFGSIQASMQNSSIWAIMCQELCLPQALH